MRRLNPIGSLIGILLTLLLFIGLGFSLWFNRGLAFSPGAITAKSKEGVLLKGYSSHADFEKECSNCHEPLQTSLAQKCLDCHADIDQQTKSGQGAHSQIDNIDNCASCHPDHRGHNFDPTKVSYQLFDHSKTGFSSNWHQVNYDATPMECVECHKNPSFSSVDNLTCLDCHSKHEKNFAESHVSRYGQDCQSCHDGLDRMQDFKHEQTGYPLEGKHAQINCTDCHQNNNITATPKDCKDCHSEPTMHQGLFDQACETCHAPQRWSPAKLENEDFGHLVTTGFSLALHQTDYSNQNITCITCHPKDNQTLDIQTCIDCHDQHDTAFMADHQQQYSTSCMDCHDGVDRLSNFDHAKFFPLDGKHAEAQCADCHADKVFRGTPSECWQCHQEPEIHAGVFGLQCDDCHDAQAWSPANLKKHAFPINHSVEDQNKQLPCDACHGTNYIDYTCYNCHEHQAVEITQSHQAVGILEQDLAACATCHPAGVVEENQKAP